MALETDGVRKSQAALEAVEVLRETGFIVEDFEVSPEKESPSVGLGLQLSIPEYERPIDYVR